ncbi:gamma carbonic anhydrase family protein, partial [Acinetobacter baumannii]
MYSYQGQHPKALHEPWDGWVAPTATLIGQVELGRQVSIWFGAVVRADNCVVRIG